MLKIENTEVLGWEAAIRGMRNPMNSWEKSDSLWFDGNEYHDVCGNDGPAPENLNGTGFDLGYSDHNLMMNLAKAGSTDAKYRRMINVTADVTAPLYWWKEYDTYKVGTVANSCSTMHKIHSKEFTLDDFSHEHLDTIKQRIPIGSGKDDSYYLDSSKEILLSVIGGLNAYRNLFLSTKDKAYWYQMIQLLPSSYNQRRTIQLNYEVLAAIYPKRKDHKLDEWHTFCDWIKSLPYSELITLED